MENTLSVFLPHFAAVSEFILSFRVLKCNEKVPVKEKKHKQNFNISVLY